MRYENRLRRLEDRRREAPVTVVELMQAARDLLAERGEEYDPLTGPSCNAGIIFLGEETPRVCECGHCSEFIEPELEGADVTR